MLQYVCTYLIAIVRGISVLMKRKRYFNARYTCTPIKPLKMKLYNIRLLLSTAMTTTSNTYYIILTTTTSTITTITKNYCSVVLFF
jgi:hypothetical protein